MGHDGTYDTVEYGLVLNSTKHNATQLFTAAYIQTNCTLFVQYIKVTFETTCVGQLMTRSGRYEREYQMGNGR